MHENGINAHDSIDFCRNVAIQPIHNLENRRIRLFRSNRICARDKFRLNIFKWQYNYAHAAVAAAAAAATSTAVLQSKSKV